MKFKILSICALIIGLIVSFSSKAIADYSDETCAICSTGVCTQYNGNIELESGSCTYILNVESRTCGTSPVTYELRIKSIGTYGSGCNSSPDNTLFAQMIQRILFYYTQIFNLQNPNPFISTYDINFINSDCWSWDPVNMALVPCPTPCCKTKYTLLKEVNTGSSMGYDVKVMTSDPNSPPIPPPSYSPNGGQTCNTHCAANVIQPLTVINIPSYTCPETCYWTIFGNTEVTDLNYIGTNVDVPLIFKSNGIEGMRMIDNGQVGIFNQNPKDALTIGEKMNFHIGANNYYIGFNDYLAAADQYNPNGSRKRMANTGIAHNQLEFSGALNFNSHQLNSSGVISLGTAGSGYADDVIWDYQTSNKYEETNGGFKGLTIMPTSDNSHGLIGLGTYPWYTNVRVLIKGLTTTNSTAALQVTNFDASKTMIYARDDGNVGIGTSSPSTLAKLHVAGKIKIDDLTGSGNYLVTADDNGILHMTTTAPTNNWSLTGNDVTGLNNISLGTTSLNPLSIIVGGSTKLTILTNGNVGIGITNPRAPLVVNGMICATEVHVSLNGDPCWYDVVFDSTYKLMNLNDLEKEIKELKHLPNIPSAEEIRKNGVEIGEMEAKFLQKIEELTLYVIDLKKENDKIKEQIKNLKK